MSDEAVLATDNARREFIDNLSAMATGSYLREEDREFWDAPFPSPRSRGCRDPAPADPGRVRTGREVVCG